MRILVFGYDRDLLKPDSDAARRQMAFAEQRNLYLDIALLSRGERDQDIRLSERVRVRMFRGNIFRRLWKSFRAGIHESMHLMSAQDPFASAMLAFAVSRWRNIPFEIQEHADFYSGEWEKETPFINRFLAFLGKRFLKRADAVRAVSERVKEHLVARAGVSPERISVFSVSQDLSGLLALPLRPWPSDAPTIVMPCRFVRQKGIGMALEAFTRVRDSGSGVEQGKGQRAKGGYRRTTHDESGSAHDPRPMTHGFRVELYGSGKLEGWIKKRIDELGLQDVVSVMPWTEPVDIWKRADLFVLSSTYEGWGRTVVEAMAAGVPVVTTNVGCVGSFFRPQLDGRVVEPHDADALASAIREQFDEGERRERMRVNARERARSFPNREMLQHSQIESWRHARERVTDGSRRFDLWVIAFVAFAVLSRAASVILFHHSLLNRDDGPFILVQSWFQELGYTFANQLGCPSAYRSPGFLFFLTALYTFFSPDNTLAQAIVQNIVAVGILWLVYVVGKELVGKRAALIGAFLMAAYPYTFYHYTQYYHTFLSSFFLLLLVWFLLKLAKTKRPSFAFGAGASIAALAYVQGTILAATPFIVLWLWWYWRFDWKKTCIAAAIMAVVSAGLIAPWTYRNSKAFHAFVPLTTDLGFGFAKANNENIYALTKYGYPQESVNDIIVSSTNPGYVQYHVPVDTRESFAADGLAVIPSILWTEWHPKEPVRDTDENNVSCSELGPLNEAEYGEYWKNIGMAWLSSNWFSEGWKLQLLKIKTFWQPSLFPSVKMGAAWPFADNPLKVWLARLSLTVAASIVIFGGFFGLGLSLAKKNRRVWLPIAIIVIYTVMHSLFAGYTKYRIPLDNLMAMYAGYALVTLWDAFRNRKQKTSV